MPTVDLRAEASPDKYGLVRVYTFTARRLRRLEREYKITGAVLAVFRGAKSLGQPPGTTTEEWAGVQAGTHAVTVIGKGLEVGDVEEGRDEKGDPNGNLLIKYAEDAIGGRFVESYLRLRAGEWTGTPSRPEINAAKITELNADPDRRRKGEKTLVAITAGRLDYS